MKRRALIILTVFNIVLFLLSLMAYFETKENLEQFNSTENDYDYTDKGQGLVVLFLNPKDKVTIEFDETSVMVRNAYRYDDRPMMVKIICFIRYYCDKNGVEITRNNSDLWGELRLHTTLYKMGNRQSQTRNADIDYTSDERWYVNVISSVLGRMGI